MKDTEEKFQLGLWVLASIKAYQNTQEALKVRSYDTIIGDREYQLEAAGAYGGEGAIYTLRTRLFEERFEVPLRYIWTKAAEPVQAWAEKLMQDSLVKLADQPSEPAPVVHDNYGDW